MNAPTETTRTQEMSFAQILTGLARHYLAQRRTLLLLGGGVLATGLALNWDWVVAIGLAPILLALAPCAVMCALGVCMHKMEKKPGADNSQTKADPES